MKTMLVLAASASLAAAAGAAGPSSAEAAPVLAEAGEAVTRTRWEIHPSLGLDAVVFLGALSGDAMQARIYADEVAMFRARLTEDERAALDRIGAAARDAEILTGPFLALLFSVGDTRTLNDLIASADDPEARLRPPFERTPYWDAEQWPWISELVRTDVALALRGLRRAGFDAYWREAAQPAAHAAAARYEGALSGYDVIAEQERLLGRPLDPVIELVVLHFSQPYGIRITGQRFISHHTYAAESQLRIAAHEIFHPPFDRGDAALLASLAPLRDDPWMVSIVEDHDPSFGYTTFLGVLDEDSAEALDQIVSERLGVAHDPAERWRRHDGGMHMLAAALYRAMKDDGFDETGGAYEAWLRGAVARGLLAPANVKRLAAQVVGEEAVDAWGPDRSVAD